MRSDPETGTPPPSHRLPVHVIGNVNLDLVMGPVPPWPTPGTETVVEQEEVRAGGAAGVTALALQALGVTFTLHATIGRDDFGEVVRRKLGPAGSQLQVVEAPTVYSVGVGHPNGERTFLTSRGHLDQLDVDRLLGDLGAAEPGLVLVCGYFLLPALRARIVEVLEAATMRGHRVLLDTGWPSEGFTPAVRAELGSMLGFLDIVTPNEAEARGWTGEVDAGVASRALALGGVTVVLKRGGSGARLVDREVVRDFAAPSVPLVDTVGAGDCFNAALLAALSARRPVDEAVARAVAYATTVIGTRPRRYAAN
ncbi:MAG: carbohydrate kinase family protein [Trueperaceae bacterium]